MEIFELNMNKIKMFKKAKPLVLACIFVLLAGGNLFSLTLEDLNRSVSLNNPDLLKLQEEYERALLDVKDAKAGIGPVVDLQLTGTYMTKPPVDAIYLNVDELLNSIAWPGGTKPSTGSQYVKIYDGMENTLYNFQLTVTQPIFTWGKLYNAVKLYSQIADIKQTQILSQEEQLKMELETRVITLKYLERIVNILDEEKVFAQRLVEVSESAEKSGMLLHQDVVEARIQAKELEIAQQDVSEQVHNQLLELQRMTGIADLALNQIEYEIDESRFNQIINADRTVIEETALSGEQLSIKMLTQLKEVNQTAEKIARGYVNWKPDLALQASAGYGGSRFPFAEPNWLRKDDYSANITIAVKTTVWDGGKKVRDVSRKASESKTADINQLDARTTIRQTLSSQWNTADVCSMKIEYQNLKIESDDAKISQQETIFQTGYGSETDVLSAKINRCNNQIEKEKQELSRAVALMTIEYLGK